METSLRLFVSADLAGSTAFKQQGDNPLGWQKSFRNFYQELPALLVAHYKPDYPPEKRLQGWKLIGDEMVFSAQLTRWDDALYHVQVFRRAVADLRAGLVSNLDVKAAAWTAGFPVGNIKIEATETFAEDYIGPSMDIGFRLVKAASPRRMLLSVETAWLLTLQDHTSPPTIYASEGLELKGVAKGKSYPCLWLDNYADGLKTSPTDELLLSEESLRGINRRPCSITELHTFCTRWLELLGSPFLVPFIKGDSVIGKMPEKYSALYDSVTQEAEQGSLLMEPSKEAGAHVRPEDILQIIEQGFGQITDSPPHSVPHVD